MLAANSLVRIQMVRIQTALGRAVADTFSNRKSVLHLPLCSFSSVVVLTCLLLVHLPVLSAVGCLMTSFGIDAPLALFMLCILPVIGIVVGIVSCHIRRSSGMALKEFASVGAFASEVLTGIQTIASLRAERWAVERYTTHVADAQKFSVQSQIYSKLASGHLGVLSFGTLPLHSSLGHIR